MLGGIPRRWVYVCIAKRNLLDISEIHAAGFTFNNHLEASLCIQHGVMEDRRFLRMVFIGSYKHTQNTCHSIPHDLGMILGFYRPQKDLSWAEKQAF